METFGNLLLTLVLLIFVKIGIETLPCNLALLNKLLRRVLRNSSGFNWTTPKSQKIFISRDLHSDLGNVENVLQKPLSIL